MSSPLSEYWGTCPPHPPAIAAPDVDLVGHQSSISEMSPVEREKLEQVSKARELWILLGFSSRDQTSEMVPRLVPS